MPLLTTGSVGRHNVDRIRDHQSSISHTSGQFLLLDVGDKRINSGIRSTLHPVACGVEKRHDRIQVTIGLGAGSTTTHAHRRQVLIQVGGGPDLPQHFLHAAALPARGDNLANAA